MATAALSFVAAPLSQNPAGPSSSRAASRPAASASARGLAWRSASVSGQQLPASGASSIGARHTRSSARRAWTGAAARSAVVASSAAAASPGDITPQYSPAFVRHRIGVFLSILFGYACYYLTRNSLTFTAPVMVATPSLGLDITSIGFITSVFPLFYGCSKFVSGVVGDRLSPSIMLGTGLLLTGAVLLTATSAPAAEPHPVSGTSDQVCSPDLPHCDHCTQLLWICCGCLCAALVNIAFGFSTSLTVWCFLWALNGILQGWGAPACAKILTGWFATKERGTYWGMWNIAHNLGGFSAPILAGTAARSLGWQWGLWAPGLIGGAVALIILFTLKESPEAAGFPPVEDPNLAKEAKKAKEAAAQGAPGEESLSLLANLKKNVLSNPFIWGLALTYFCVYIIRQAVTSWSVFYLIKEKGVADAGAAALRVSGLEIGGLIGSLVAGRISDYAIAKGGPGGAVGKRVKVVMVYMVGVAVMLFAFKLSPPGVGWLQTLCVFMIGFFLYGPQMLIGLCGAEIVGRRSVGASEGFLGWVAYLGAANAGVPLSMLVQKFGWDAFFTTLIGACGLALLLLAPISNAKSFVQREALQAAKAA